MEGQGANGLVRHGADYAWRESNRPGQSIHVDERHCMHADERQGIHADERHCLHADEDWVADQTGEIIKTVTECVGTW